MDLEKLKILRTQLNQFIESPMTVIQFEKLFDTVNEIIDILADLEERVSTLEGP